MGKTVVRLKDWVEKSNAAIARAREAGDHARVEVLLKVMRARGAKEGSYYEIVK